MPSTARPAPDRGALIAGLLVLYVVWGSTYLGIAVAVQTIPPFLMAAGRFLLAGAILMAWSMARDGRPFVGPTRREWRDSAIVGALLLGGGMGMVAWGEQTVPSGIAALLVAMMPVWVAIFGGIFLRQAMPRLAIAGVVIGFIGVAILVGPTAFGATGALDPAGLIAVFVAPVCWATGALFASHRATLPSRALVATAAQMLTGGAVLAAMAAVTGEFGRFDPSAVSADSVAAFIYLTTIGSLVGFTVFGWLVGVAPLPLVTTYAYVNPVVAVILGAVVLSEPIDARTVIAGAVIVAAVALIVTARGRMAAPRSRATGVSAPPAPSAPRAEPGPSRSASG